MSEKANEILKNIKEKNIKPISRWKFIFKDYLIWGFFGLATIVGAVAMSVIIFIIKDNDWDIYKYLEKSFFSYMLILLPYFWIVILFILAYLAYVNYRQTRKGYLINPYGLIIGSVLLSVVLGWALFNLKVGSYLDKICAKSIPYYSGTEMQKKSLWSSPEKGLLAGEIIDFKTDKNFVIKDLNNEKWEIEGSETSWKKDVNKEVGEEIKIIGVYVAKNKFKAREVRPWSCQCQKCTEGGKDNHKCTVENKSEGQGKCSK